MNADHCSQHLLWHCTRSLKIEIHKIRIKTHDIWSNLVKLKHCCNITNHLCDVFKLHVLFMKMCVKSHQWGCWTLQIFHLSSSFWEWTPQTSDCLTAKRKLPNIYLEGFRSCPSARHGKVTFAIRSPMHNCGCCPKNVKIEKSKHYNIDVSFTWVSTKASSEACPTATASCWVYQKASHSR